MVLSRIVCNDTGFTPTPRLHRKELQYWLPTSGKLNHPFHLMLSPLGGVEEASQVTLGLLPTLVVLIGFLFLLFFLGGSRPRLGRVWYWTRDRTLAVSSLLSRLLTPRLM